MDWKKIETGKVTGLKEDWSMESNRIKTGQDFYRIETMNKMGIKLN